jgi:hypothetical protein
VLGFEVTRPRNGYVINANLGVCVGGGALLYRVTMLLFTRNSHMRYILYYPTDRIMSTIS